MPIQLTANIPRSVSVHKVVLGFIAGFLAVLLLHQPVLAFLTSVGLAKANVWGVVFALVEGHIPRGAAYWFYAFLFGAIFPTLVAWFIVAPSKGQPVAGGWDAARMLTGVIINGSWGFGTALFLALGESAIRRHERA